MASVLLLSACGSGGSIEFFDGTSPAGTPRGVATTMVPASIALAIESGKTTADGYHAKLQLNPRKGRQLSGGGYSVELKHTTRNR